MNREADLFTTYFQIRWSPGVLDWERHDTRTQAEESAKKLTHPDEEFTVEEIDERARVAATKIILLRTSNPMSTLSDKKISQRIGLSVLWVQTHRYQALREIKEQDDKIAIEMALLPLSKEQRERALSLIEIHMKASQGKLPDLQRIMKTVATFDNQ